MCVNHADQNQAGRPFAATGHNWVKARKLIGRFEQESGEGDVLRPSPRRVERIDCVLQKLVVGLFSRPAFHLGVA